MLRSLLGVVCAVVLIAGAAAPAEAATTPGAASFFAGSAVGALPPVVSSGSAVSAAQSTAVATGAPVVVDSLTTPTELTTAMPDGTVQYEASSQPVRVSKGGSWIPVDTDLAKDGQWWSPKASAAAVRFSPGGGSVLAQVQSPSGDWISEVWPYGTLPVPSIDGDTATYSEVFAGVDLKLGATKTGMASVYVVKSEQAALSAPLEKLHVAVQGATLVRDSSGAVTADTGASTASPPLIAGQPLWWDSSNGGTYREPGGEETPLPVTHAVLADRVSLDVGDSVLAEKSRSADPIAYPIYVDPDWSSGITASWYTDKAYPNQSYLSAGFSNVLRVGLYQQYLSDMFFQFPLSPVAGKQIISARLNTTLVEMAATGVQPLKIATYTLYPGRSAGFTWNQEQTWNATAQHGWGATLQTQNPVGTNLPVGWDVTTGVRSKLGDSAIQFVIAPTTTSGPSRRHFSRAATLIVTYNSTPSVPTNQGFISPMTGCSTAVDPQWVSNAGDLGVQATFSDPDAGNVKGRFRVVKASAPGAVIWQADSALAAQGVQKASIPANALADGDYAWEAQTIDQPGLGSGWSAKCYFNVRNTGPKSLPQISASGSAKVGQPLTVTFTTDPADGVEYIVYTMAAAPVSDGFVFDVFDHSPGCGLYGAQTVRLTCVDTSGKATVTLAPAANVSTIWAISYDKAGNPARVPGVPVSEAGKHGSGHQVTAVNDPNVSYQSGHVWRTLPQSSPLGDSIPDTNQGQPVALTLGKDTARTLTSNPQAPNIPLPKPVLGFVDPTSSGLAGPNYTASAGSVIMAGNSFSMAAWLKPGIGGSDRAMSIGSSLGTLGVKADSWEFCRKGSDFGAASCVSAPRSSASNWVHVAGVYDAVSQELRLYIDGAWAATGMRGLSGEANPPSSLVAVGVTTDSWGRVSSRWTGQIADPAVFQGVATASQLQVLRSGSDPADG